jgi:inorganic phosphate transporter, PiT family
MVSLLVAVILVALVFDFINGFHDAANAIATVVSTGVLPVRTAVVFAGVLNWPRPSPRASPTRAT